MPYNRRLPSPANMIVRHHNKMENQNNPDAGTDIGFVEAQDPFELFELWMKDAEHHEQAFPNAMSLASVDENGLPNIRVVLLKEADRRGFVFYTNFESAKGRELAHAGQAALGFYWKSLSRQVRVRGNVEQVADADADEYFASRPRESCVGAWASRQSDNLEDRKILDDAVSQYDEKFSGGDVPRPPYWSGYRLVPMEIEFWQARQSRLHDRIVFRRSALDEAWSKTLLYP